jgi:DNA-binding protein HU-beta
MTKQEFIDVVAKSAGNENISKTAVRQIVDATFAEMVNAIKKEQRFAVPGFGTFTVRERQAKTGRNPKTGESIKIKASKTIGFKPAPSVKDAL